MSSRRFAVALLLIAAFAFAGRVVYIFTVTHDELSTDQRYFYESAVQLADGEFFQAPPLFGSGESAEHPPLPVTVLAPVALVSSDNDSAMRTLVAFGGVCALLLIALVTAEVAGRRAGLVAAAIAAVYPNLWINDGIFMSETFATLFTAGAIFACYRLIRHPSAARAVVLGVACALSMLSRAELALLVPLLVVPVLLSIRGISFTRRLRIAGSALGATAVLVAPWVGYNLARFDEPVLLSSGDGGVLAGANCNRTYWGADLGSWNGLCTIEGVRNDRSFDLIAHGDRSMDNVETRNRGLAYMKDHARRLPVVIAARIGRLWSVFAPFQMAKLAEGEGKPRWASWAGLGGYWLLVGFAVAGTVLLWRRHEVVLPLLAPIAVVTLVAAALYGLVRFRAPAEVSIVALAAVAIDRLFPGSPPSATAPAE